MKKALFSYIGVSFFLIGCAETTPAPVDQPNPSLRKDVTGGGGGGGDLSCSDSTPVESIPFVDPVFRECFLYTVQNDREQGRTIEVAADVDGVYCWAEPGYRYFNVTNLGGIECLSNLNWLSLGHPDDATGTIDLGPLTSLRHLEGVSLMGPRIRDLSPLARVFSLKYLSLLRTEVDTLDSLAGHPSLTSFGLAEHPKPYNIYALNEVPNFQSASVYGSSDDFSTQQLSAVASLPNVKHLYVSGYWTEVGQYVSNAAQLESLTVDSDAAIDLANLSNLTHLTSLNIGYWARMTPTNLAGIEALSALEGLSIQNQRVSDISRLAGLRKLQWLDLYMNEIQDIGPLGSLQNLLGVNLGENRIRDVTALRNLPNLAGATLDWNQLQSIAPLYGLGKLMALYVMDNRDIPCYELERMQQIFDGRPGSSFGHSLECRDIPPPPPVDKDCPRSGCALSE